MLLMCQNKISLVYQYFLFNADRLKEKKKISVERLKRAKDISSEEFLEVYTDILKSDIFEEITSDIFELLKF